MQMTNDTRMFARDICTIGGLTWREKHELGMRAFRASLNNGHGVVEPSDLKIAYLSILLDRAKKAAIITPVAPQHWAPSYPSAQLRTISGKSLNGLPSLRFA